jgi:DNA-binding transcriptional ArsR family regulator
MDLVSLFKSGERLRILDYVMQRESLQVTSVAEALGLSKGLVSQHMKLLGNWGLLERDRSGTYSPVDGFMSRQVKRLINLTKIDVNRLDLETIQGIGMYGSWALGTNTIESDADVWVRAKEYPSQERLAALSAQLRKMMGCEVRLLVLTPSKMRGVMKDEAFYSNLRKDSVLLWGEDIG